MYFLGWIVLTFKWNIIETSSLGSSWQYVSIGSLPIRRQSLIWSYDDPGDWRIYASHLQWRLASQIAGVSTVCSGQLAKCTWYSLIYDTSFGIIWKLRKQYLRHWMQLVAKVFRTPRNTHSYMPMAKPFDIYFNAMMQRFIISHYWHKKITSSSVSCICWGTLCFIINAPLTNVILDLFSVFTDLHLNSDNCLREKCSVWCLIFL